MAYDSEYTESVRAEIMLQIFAKPLLLMVATNADALVEC